MTGVGTNDAPVLAQAASVQMESKRLPNTVVAAMWRDIQSPLTALVRHAEALAESNPWFESQHCAALSPGRGARDLSALVANLLEMAWLESGQVALHKEWQSVEWAVGSAIRAARHGLAWRGPWCALLFRRICTWWNLTPRAWSGCWHAQTQFARGALSFSAGVACVKSSNCHEKGGGLSCEK